MKNKIILLFSLLVEKGKDNFGNYKNNNYTSWKKEK
jgi:hypothetical protein